MARHIENGHPYRGGIPNGDALPPDFYRVFVDYAPLPLFLELLKEFPGWASFIFNGRPFTNHASCKDVDETPGEKTFWLADPPDKMRKDSEKIIAWGGQQKVAVPAKRVRPATAKEARAFAKVYPGLQRHYPIVALGSSAVYDGRQCVAALTYGNGRRRIVGHWLDSWWDRSCRFLFVCE